MGDGRPDAPVVVREDGRFVVRQHGTEAELVYEITDEGLVLVHTGVPESMGGHGIGGALVGAAVAWAASQGLPVVPWCPFARAWLHDHPAQAATVTVDWRSRPRR